jgi:hypothetical protein
MEQAILSYDEQGEPGGQFFVYKVPCTLYILQIHMPTYSTQYIKEW